MPVTLRYLGWSAFEIVLEDGRRVALDPSLSGVPEQEVPPSPAKLEELDGVDVVMVTHAAGDHLGQSFEIMQRGKARLVCDVVSRVLALAEGIAGDRIVSMIPGVQFDLGGLLVKALPAQHLSFRQLGENAYVSGPPLSYLITTPGKARIFFGGDTSISKDHQLFGQLYKPQAAVLGVGGVRGAMGQSVTELSADEAALVAKWLKVRTAIPIHYRFDEGEKFAKALKKVAPTIRAVLLRPGESFGLSGRKR